MNKAVCLSLSSSLYQKATTVKGLFPGQLCSTWPSSSNQLPLCSVPLTLLFFKLFLEPPLPGRFLECLMGESILFHSASFGSLLFSFPTIPVRHLSLTFFPTEDSSWGVSHDTLNFSVFPWVRVFVLPFSPSRVYPHLCFPFLRESSLEGCITYRPL